MFDEASPEGIRTIEFLRRASPEAVYHWFEARPRRESFEGMFPLASYEGLEEELLKRNNEIIDLALAAWGSEKATHSYLLNRYCTSQSGTLEIPDSGSFGNSILANLLSNENIVIGVWTREVDNWFFNDEFFEKILSHTEDLKFFDIIHLNRALCIRNIISLANKSGAYGEMPIDLWIGAINRSADNERIYKFYDYKIDSLLKQSFMQAVLKICLISPKTVDAANACTRLCERLPNIYTIPELDDLLVQAVDAWGDDNLPDDAGLKDFDFASSWDGMRTNERLQFHLWRVAGRIGFNPNDPRKHVRLAAYALDGVGDYSETNLKINEIEMYSQRDGAAFMYANSYNEAIWSKNYTNIEAREKILNIKFNNNETYPHNPSSVYEIRKLTQDMHEDKPTPATDKLVYHCMENTIGDIENFIKNESLPTISRNMKNLEESINARLFLLIAALAFLIFILK